MPSTGRARALLLGLSLSLGLTASALAEERSLENGISQFTLANGMQVVVIGGDDVDLGELARHQ